MRTALSFVFFLSVLISAPGCSAQSAQEHKREREVTATRDNNTTLGNPSEGRYDMDEYLLELPQFTLSYNSRKGIPNWVSWHLSTAWKGDAERCNCFTIDQQLPKSYFAAKASHYIGTGFDKGHLCPSDDRDGSPEDNRATFLMTNMAPQAPNLNRDVWEHLESYCRKLIAEGDELYIIAGSYGEGGDGAKGAKERIGNKSIVVPERFWKVVVVLPVGDDDLNRVNKATRIIAVDMPNSQNANAYPWHHYRTSVDAIEAATGYNLLSAIPDSIQEVIEAKTDEAGFH